jgi:hypothetical protein
MYSYNRQASEKEYRIIGKVTRNPYTVYYHESAKCWTYRDKRKYGPSLGFRSNHHDTPEAVIERIQKVDDPIEAAEGDGSSLTRRNYEALARKLRVKVLSDKEIDSYGIRYGDFTYPQYKAPHIMAMALAFRRLKALDEEPREPREVLPGKPAPWGSGGVRYDEACDRCGRIGEVDNTTGLCRRCHS